MLERNTLRSMIVTHPNWDSLRLSHGIDIANANTSCLRLIGHHLGIDPIPNHDWLDNYYTNSKPRLTEVFKVSIGSFDPPPAPMPVTDTIKHEITPPMAQTPIQPSDNRRKLLETLLDTLLNGNGVLDEAAVNACIDKRLASLNVVTIRHIHDAPLPIPSDITKTAHPALKTLLRALSVRQRNGYRPNVFISGPTGSGKTYAGKQVSEAFGLAFHHQGAMAMSHEVTGFVDGNGRFHESAFTRATEHGGVLLLDEMDSSDNMPLLAVKAAMSGHEITLVTGKVVKRHPDCVILAAANTWGQGANAEYVGRNKLDAALLSDFPAKVFWGYDEAFERSLCSSDAWVSHFHNVRSKATRAGLKVILCPRILLAGDAYVSSGMSINEASDLTYRANLTNEQRNLLG
jgi:AAA domain (dynein-related subfamily)